MLSFYVILTGILVAIPCALLGTFLVLRKMVMVGDAISHAVLPGIVIAFFITESFNSAYMLLGAGIIGVLTTFLIEFFHKKGKLQEDASIGVTFTWMFAIGVILISTFLKNTDLDLDCVLYGEILNAPFNLWITDSGINLGPISVWLLGSISLVVLIYVIVGYKELLLTTFDPSFANSIGISTEIWHYSLMSCVSFTTVSAFESVGAILVVSFLVIPPATAYLLTDKLKNMLFLSSFFSVMSVVGGYYSSIILDITTSGSMTCFSFLIFLLVFIFSPTQGIFKKTPPIETTSI